MHRKAESVIGVAGGNDGHDYWYVQVAGGVSEEPRIEVWLRKPKKNRLIRRLGTIALSALQGDIDYAVVPVGRQGVIAGIAPAAASHVEISFESGHGGPVPARRIELAGGAVWVGPMPPRERLVALRALDANGDTLAEWHAERPD